jgi:hypothetical protein
MQVSKIVIAQTWDDLPPVVYDGVEPISTRKLASDYRKQAKELETLRAKVSEYEGEGNATAAEMLHDWWSGANIQGRASMSGEEMTELAGFMDQAQQEKASE